VDLLILNDVLMNALPAVVQPDAVGAGGASDAMAVQSVWDFVQKGGIMMIPLGICSLAALAVVAERLIVLRKSNIIPAGFLKKLGAIIDESPQDAGKAIKYCEKNGSALANICAAGLSRRGLTLDLIEKRITEAGERELFKLRKYLRVLSVIASVSPLLGLVGTIFGMIKAFQTVAVSADALGKTEMLATGIYEAMITTAAGLLVAIPALIFYNLIASKIDHRVSEMDLLIIDFVESHLDDNGHYGAAAQSHASTDDLQKPTTKNGSLAASSTLADAADATA
jgi:biopolymer transport protein ExbB